MWVALMEHLMRCCTQCTVSLFSQMTPGWIPTTPLGLLTTLSFRSTHKAVNKVRVGDLRNVLVVWGCQGTYVSWHDLQRSKPDMTPWFRTPYQGVLNQGVMSSLERYKSCRLKMPRNLHEPTRLAALQAGHNPLVQNPPDRGVLNKGVMSSLEHCKSCQLT